MGGRGTQGKFLKSVLFCVILIDHFAQEVERSENTGKQERKELEAGGRGEEKAFKLLQKA